MGVVVYGSVQVIATVLSGPSLRSSKSWRIVAYAGSFVGQRLTKAVGSWMPVRMMAAGVAIRAAATVPVLPSLVAVIVAVPTATAVTKPVELTVAFVASDVVQVIVRPVSVAPVASSVVAVNCCVLPRTPSVRTVRP